MTAQRGSELHAFAANAIRLGVQLPDNGQTLSMYVNDAIRFRMIPEQMLFYSRNCYGTADAIAFRETQRLLRISDLKNGVNEANMEQLLIYAGIFLREYGFKPTEVDIELRIYQNDDVKLHRPDADEMFHIVDAIITKDRHIERLRKELAL